ncbi:MAG: hypothetical protein QOJ59_1802 [Thermomicrobiales bacterium]|jgi:hypothetical protein|nr:hypothetical protein [Thermomicrobiales bacterium]
MATTSSTLEQQAEAYERHVRDNWDRLPAWEQEQAQRYFAWRDANSKSLFDQPQGVSTRTSHGASSWAIKAGYLCAVAAFLLSPLVFAPVGVLIGVFNIVRGRYGHGIAQVFLTVSCAVLAVVVSALLLDWIGVLQDRLIELQTRQR